jgi:hypothetical protein
MLQIILCMHSRRKQHKDITAWEAAPWPYLIGALRIIRWLQVGFTLDCAHHYSQVIGFSWRQRPWWCSCLHVFICMTRCVVSVHHMLIGMKRDGSWNIGLWMLYYIWWPEKISSLVWQVCKENMCLKSVGCYVSLWNAWVNKQEYVFRL